MRTCLKSRRAVLYSTENRLIAEPAPAPHRSTGPHRSTTYACITNCLVCTTCASCLEMARRSRQTWNDQLIVTICLCCVERCMLHSFGWASDHRARSGIGSCYSLSIPTVVSAKLVCQVKLFASERAVSGYYHYLVRPKTSKR